MNKIRYRHGAMYSGKSLNLLSLYRSYEYKNIKSIVLKSSKDTRDEEYISSRMTDEILPCVLFKEEDSLIDLVMQITDNTRTRYDVIMIDEIQFASKEQISELHELSRDYTIFCFGLKASYTGELFPSIASLIALTEDIVEIKSECCMCRSKATHNLLVRNDKPIYTSTSEDLINIEGANPSEKYYAVCREHFYEPILSSIKDDKIK